MPRAQRKELALDYLLDLVGDLNYSFDDSEKILMHGYLDSDSEPRAGSDDLDSDSESGAGSDEEPTEPPAKRQREGGNE